MSRRSQSLAGYASRRLALAGSGLISEHNPYMVAVDRLQQECESRGQRLLSFAHYDYLSLSDDARLVAAAADALRAQGLGASGSRFVGGERVIHGALERDLARFVGTESALALVSGYGTNVALVGHLLSSGDLILVDAYAHNSILTGTKLSRADTKTFRHNDLEHLVEILESVRGHYRRALVVVEGLYSMDGDIPDLPRLLEIARRYDLWLMIDEAHSIGVLGRTGRGLCEHFGIDPARIDLIVGTLSKSLVTCGGFVCGKAEVIEWLRYTLPGFVYSVGLPPHIAATVCMALSIIAAEPHRVDRLQRISEHFVSEARRHGFDIGTAIGAGIVPIRFADVAETFSASQALMSAAIYVPPVVQLGIPKDMPRLRFFLSSRHTPADIGQVFRVLANWRDRCGQTKLQAAT